MLRRCAPALLFLLLGLPATLSAQYFGQNKVQYESFGFKIIETQHFDVYFYERERPAAWRSTRTKTSGAREIAIFALLIPLRLLLCIPTVQQGGAPACPGLQQIWGRRVD